MKATLPAVAALAALTLLGPGVVQAQRLTFITADAGPYWGVDAGAVIPLDGHMTEFAGLPSGQKVRYDVGAAFDMVLGYAFNRWVSAEVETGFRWTSVDSIQDAWVDDTDYSAVPILANIVLQYPIPRTRIVPYLGAGVGGAATMLDIGMISTPAGDFWGDTSDFVFAWQLFAGVRVELSPHVSIGLAYKFVSADPSKFEFLPADCCGPELNLGFSSYQAHMAVLSANVKF